MMTAAPAFAATTAPTPPADSASPTATTTPEAVAEATKPSFAPTEKVTYWITGLAPDVSLSTITITAPGGASISVEPVNETSWVVDSEGNYAGEFIASAPLPEGNYDVTITQDYTDASGPAQHVVTFTFTIAAESTSTPTPTTEPSATTEPTATAEPTATPVPTETATPTPTSTATPSPTTTPTVEAPVAYANASSFLPTDDIDYTAQNFTPGLALDITVVYPDGASVEVEPIDDSVVAEDGTFSGALINQSGAPLPLGEYTVTLSQSSGLSASFTFLVAEANPGTTTAPTATTAPVPGGNGGNGGGTNTGHTSPELATTGAEDAFGAAGIGLLALATGAGVLVARRLAAKKA